MDTAPESSWGGTGWVYRAIQHTCREAQYLIEKRLEWVQGIGQVCTFVVSNGNVFWRLNLICSSNSETWKKRGARGVMMIQTDRQSSSWQPNLESVPVPVQSPFSEIHWQWYHQSFEILVLIVTFLYECGQLLDTAASCHLLLLLLFCIWKCRFTDSILTTMGKELASQHHLTKSQSWIRSHFTPQERRKTILGTDSHPQQPWMCHNQSCSWSLSGG